MLDVRLPVRIDGGKENAGLGCDEYGEVIGDGGLPATALFHAGIVGARTLAGLDRLDRGRERDIAGIVWHDQGPRLQREGGRPAGGQVAAEPLAAGVLPLVGTRAVPTCDATSPSYSRHGRDSLAGVS